MTIRKCAVCGEVRPHYAKGLCSGCYQKAHLAEYKAYQKAYYQATHHKATREEIARIRNGEAKK